MKHYVLASLCGLTAVSAFANSSSEGYFAGIYGGVRAGWVLRSMNTNTTQTALGENPLNQTISLVNSITAVPNDAGFGGGYYLGYGHTMQFFYLAAEIFGNFNNSLLSENHSVSQATTGFNMQINTSNTVTTNIFEYGVDLRPGMLVTPKTLIYGRVGVAFNQLQLDSNNTLIMTDTVAPPYPAAETTLNGTSNKLAAGLRLGLGVQQYVGKNIAMSADYIYTDYGCLSVNNATDSQNTNPVNPPIPNGFINNTSACVSTNAIMLGATYYFSA